MSKTLEPVSTTVRVRLRVAYPALAGIAGRFALPALFVALTLVMTWPLPLHAGSAVQDLGDPLYEIWTMRWVQHALIENPSHLWDANVGYPYPRSFLFSEPRLSTSLVAWPIQAISGNPVLTYNAMFLLSFALLGLAMALLVREITGNAGAAVLAGLLAAFTPYRFGHLSHLNLLSYGWGVLALWWLVRFARRRRLGDAFIAMAALTIQVLASDTVALMTFLMIGLATLVLLWQERRHLGWKLVGGLFLALTMPLVAMAPIIQARMEVNDLYDFHRDLTVVQEMSATPASYVSVSPTNHLWGGFLQHEYPNPLFPGALALIAAGLGLILAWRGWARWALFGLVLGLAGFVLSLGPTTTIGGKEITLPYRWAYDYVPGLTSMRDVARFGMLTLLGIQLLAGLGFAALWQSARPRLGAAPRWLGAGVVVLIGVVGLLELRSAVGAVEVPNAPDDVAVYEWLAGQPDGPVLEFPANGLWTDVLLPIGQIYHSTIHWKPIVAAYTSFLPERYVDLLVTIHGDPSRPSRVTADNVGLLQDLGIGYIMIHEDQRYDWRSAVATAERLPELTPAGRFGNAHAYRLDPGAREPVSYRLVAPSRANAGRPLIASVLIENRNASRALSSLFDPAQIEVRWLDESETSVSSSSIPAPLPLSIAPGLTPVRLELTAPDRPGRYRLVVEYGDVLPQAEVDVDVSVARSAEPSDPQLAVHGVDLPDTIAHTDERLNLTIEWEIIERLSKDYAFTVQLLDNRNRPVAQIDGPPLANLTMPSEIPEGTTLIQTVTLQLPRELGPGSYRLMVAVYDTERRDLPRLLLGLPDGSKAPEGWFGPVIVRP